MSLARLVITAAAIEGRSKSEVARDYRVSRRWVQKLVARYQTEGEAAFAPRSRRPHTSPQRTPLALEDDIVALRKALAEEGLDAGAVTIHWHLAQGGGQVMQTGYDSQGSSGYGRKPRSHLTDPGRRRFL